MVHWVKPLLSENMTSRDQTHHDFELNDIFFFKQLRLDLVIPSISWNILFVYTSILNFWLCPKGMKFWVLIQGANTSHVCRLFLLCNMIDVNLADWVYAIFLFQWQSTYCASLHQHCETVRRNVHIVNLDPAAENFDYPVAMGKLYSCLIWFPCCLTFSLL